MTVPHLTQAEQKAICARHPHAALHTPPHSKQKQFYELHERDRALCDVLHTRLGAMSDWSEAAAYRLQPSHFSRLLKQCHNRTASHGKQCAITSKGVHHRGRMYIVRVYKFDNAKNVKVEIVIPMGQELTYESNLEMASEALLCMEGVAPATAVAKYPSDHHDMHFTLVRDFV